MTYATHEIRGGSYRTNWPNRKSNGWIDEVRQSIVRAFNRWVDRRSADRAIRQLRALDDRALKDIGINRSQIVSAVIHAKKGEEIKERHICNALLNQ